MAGSYSHAVADDGQLLNNEELVGMAAENGGDAYETIEEMYGMIWQLADRLDDFIDGEHGGFPRTPERRLADRMRYVEDARKAYKDGLKASPGTDGTNGPFGDDDR